MQTAVFGFALHQFYIQLFTTNLLYSVTNGLMWMIYTLTFPVFFRGMKVYFSNSFFLNDILSISCEIGLRYACWRHQMETFSTLLAICAGNSPVTSEFPAQRPVTRISDVFFDLRQNKRLSKQWWGWWFEMPSHPLWRHCNVSCRTPLIVSQRCFRHLLGAIRQQAINWPNADTYPHLSQLLHQYATKS